MENEKGQTSRYEHTGGPRDNMTMRKAAKDTQAESTDSDIWEATYLTEKVGGAERNEERAKGSREDQGASTGEINTESRHVVVVNRQLDRSRSATDEEGRAKEAATNETVTDEQLEDKEMGKLMR